MITEERVLETLPIIESESIFMELHNNIIPTEDCLTKFYGVHLNYNSLSAHTNVTTGWKMQLRVRKRKVYLINWTF